MKLKTISTVLALAAFASLNTFAQGSLTPPPGMPAPVMKSLDQVEARTPLVAGQPGVSVSPSGEITLTADGSYYLTKNLTSTNTAASCISVGDHNVTLDLNGFIISRTNGTESSTAGIHISGVANQQVMIRNGFIIGGGIDAGFSAAILMDSGLEGSVHVTDIHCARVRNGIILRYDEAQTTARRCSVETCGGQGIRAEVVTDCTVRNTVSTGIRGNSISNCTVEQGSAYPGNAIGDSLIRGAVMNCTGQAFSGIGIHAASVLNSHAASGGSAAILAHVANNCTASRINVMGTAIQATVANGCYAASGTNNIVNKYNMP